MSIDYQEKPEGNNSNGKDGSKITIAKNQAKDAWKLLKKYIVIFLILILIYNILLFAASIFKSEDIKQHVAESSEILTEETNIKSIRLPTQRVFLDNYTDALMINNCYSIDSKKPVESYMLVRKNYIPGLTDTVYTDISGELDPTDERSTILNQTGDLENVVKGKVTKSFEYGRYWHGYLSIIRPLLLIFNIQAIRVILNTIIIILSIIMLYLIAKKISIYYAIVFGIGLVSADYFVMGFSLQACFVFIIAFAASIIVLTKNKINMQMLMFITASITNYIDFLTTPLITYALPVMLYFLVQQKENELSVKQTISIIIKTAIAWGLGYGLTWLAKWIIADVVCQKNIVSTSIEQMAYRSTGNSFKYLTTVEKNLFRYNKAMGLLTITVPAIVACTKANIRGIEKIDFSKAAPYIILAITPFVWYFVLKNHSFFHAHFTCRTLLPFWLGLGFAIDKLIVIKQKNKEKANGNISSVWNNNKNK